MAEPVSIHTRTTAQCIRSAIELELRAAALYAGLAARLESPPGLRALLLGLAREEEQHAMRVRMLERLARGAPWRPPDLERHVAELEAAHARIRALEVELAGPGGSSPQGVRDAILAVEETFATLHAEMMATTLAPEVRTLFQGLTAQDVHHRELVRSTFDRMAAGGDAPAGRPLPWTGP
jgi:rubrerythrin